MRPLHELLSAMGDLAQPAIRSTAAGLALDVDTLDVNLPIESRMQGDGELCASPPRGRLATGFDPPLGAVAVTLTVEDAP